MLSFLFSPSCPVDAREKAWIETRLRWMCQQFGVHNLLNIDVLLPSDERLSSFDGSEENARPIFELLNDRLGIDSTKVVLEFVDDDEIPNAAGMYLAQEEVPRILIARSQLADSQCLVATLAHELSHQLLLGGGFLTVDVSDHEQTTDLHAVFRGLGVFAANATVRESHEQTGRAHSWSIGKRGYLTSREYGYALAVFAWARKETRPVWRSILRLDARSSFDSGLRYLQKRQDCLLQDENAISLDTDSTPHVLKGLQSANDATRVATLWNVNQMRLNSPEVVDGVVAQLCHKNPILRREAAESLGIVATPNTRMTEALVARLEDNSPHVRAAAVKSLGKLRPRADLVMPHMRFLLEDPEQVVVQSALECAYCFGADAAPQLPRILQVLRSSIVDCDYGMCELALKTAKAVVPSSAEEIRAYFESDDDLTNAVESLLSESPPAAA